MLKGKHIIVGITGSIAAYKAASLVRLLVKEGAEVKVVMTELAKQFITPLTLATLSKHPVMVEFYNPENGDWHSHVDMGLWADLYLIAPATANTLGKMAHGIADNLLLTTYLSAKCPVMVAPAMDLDMYRHPATRQNLHILQSYGVRVIEPAAGELASGLVGKGRMAEPEEEWNKLFAEYCEKFPEMKELWDKYYNGCDMSDLFNSEEYLAKPEKAEATRSSSGTILNMIKNVMPNLIGGSADLAPSNKTNMKDAGDFSKENYAGTNLHFGVREQAMAAIGNGLALHGGLRPFVATFFVFSDYTKPMARLTSLMKLPLIYVFTHDSIGVGEDGPTHEPIEQLAAFRSMPNFTVFRPCDRTETALAWEYAIESKDEPTALVLTRQNLPQMAGSSKEALKGAYILEDSDKETPDGIIIASGSEVNLAVSAKAELKNAGIDVRVVSMPSMDVFEKQSEEYKESVLPKSVRKRVAVEALSDFGWYRYVGLDGKVICMKGFGASGPANQLFEHFGFTVENVVNTVKSLF